MEVEVKSGTKTDVTSKEKIEVSANPEIEVADSTLEVTVHPQKYTIVGDDIFIINRVSNIPQWFQDILENSMNESDLARDISDLNDTFKNFKDGTTIEIGNLKNKDSSLQYQINTTKASVDDNIAGIQRLDIAKATKDEAKAISETTIGAWQNSETGGGAWFNDRVSAVSNVAYSAAKSASTLTASLNSQQDLIEQAFADISVLEKQVDGKVETWFSLENPLLGDGTINPNVEPYKTWLVNGDMELHTGDTYVYYELDAGDKKKILATFKFVKNTTSGLFEWSVFEDDLASAAYNAALHAQDTADSKVTTWFQSDPPSFLTDKDKLDATGDIWVDSDSDNKMWRWNGSKWDEVEDKRISASVRRLDEATVDVNGEARAKSSLSVDANGSIAGFVAESDGSTSAFKIFADKFTIANSEGSDLGAPFEVDTVTNDILFRGKVSFNSITGSDDIVLKPDLANPGTTVIHGDNILTGTVNANTIMANTSMTSPIINGGTVNAGEINGGNIKGVLIEGAVIKASWIDYTSTGTLTNWQYFTALADIPSAYRPYFAKHNDGSYVIDSQGYYRLPKSYPAVFSGKSGSNSTYSYDMYAYNSYKVNTTQRLMDRQTMIFAVGGSNRFYSSHGESGKAQSCWGSGYRTTTLTARFSMMGDTIDLICTYAYTESSSLFVIKRNGTQIFRRQVSGPPNEWSSVNTTSTINTGKIKLELHMTATRTDWSKECSSEQGMEFGTKYDYWATLRLPAGSQTVTFDAEGKGIALTSYSGDFTYETPTIKEI